MKKSDVREARTLLTEVRDLVKEFEMKAAELKRVGARLHLVLGRIEEQAKAGDERCDGGMASTKRAEVSIDEIQFDEED